MAPSTFRETVALVAARAKEKLPVQVNGRVESAVKLVLGHDVEPQADGSILVGSSSDPMKQYRLEGATCTCQDFVHGKAPAGWCQHRIAAGIAKRVGQLLPQVPEMLEPYPDNDPEELPQRPQQPLYEAPCSANVHLTLQGRDVLLTLRGASEAEVLQRLQTVLAAYPVPEASPISHGEGWCAVHQVQMRWNPGKDGRQGWWSHRKEDGSWCKGR